MSQQPNQTILATVATRGAQSLRFEAVRQDRRLYYRLLINDRGAGSLTDEAHALLTIDYWRGLGLIPVERCSECRLAVVSDGASICADCLDAYRPQMSINEDNL